MITAKPKPPDRQPFTRRIDSIDDLVAKRFAPRPVFEIATGDEKIIATRWRDHAGRWIYVAEILASTKPLAAHQPPLFAIFSDNPKWHSAVAEVSPLPLRKPEPKEDRAMISKPRATKKPDRGPAPKSEASAAARRGKDAGTRGRGEKPAPSMALSVSPYGAVIVEAPLSIVEKKDLARAEAMIEKNRAAYLAIGEALAEIRDRRLYRQRHGTFEDYVRDRWTFGRAEAADKIAASRVAKALSLDGDAPPEDHLKALAPVEDAADLKAIWQNVQKRAKKEHVPVTGKLVREERRRYETPPEELERGMGDGGRGTEGKSRLPGGTAAVTTATSVLSRTEQRRWDAALAELAEHVQHIAQSWSRPQCRTILAATLMELADQVEHLTAIVGPEV